MNLLTAPMVLRILTTSFYAPPVYCLAFMVVFYIKIGLEYSFERLQDQLRPRNWKSIGDNDIVLLTGGSNGLGLEISKLLQSRAKRVIVIDVEPSPYESNVEFHKCDLNNEEATLALVEKIVSDLEKENQHISVLINNAGIRHSKSLVNLLYEEIHSVFNVNVMAPIILLKSVIGNHVRNVLLRDRQAKLLVVTVSSILGLVGPKNLSVYSASKAAMIQIHESLTQEVRHYPTIRLLLVTPGQLTTRMFADVPATKQFLAPLVDARNLASEIVKKIDRGERGTLCKPLYTNFIPMMKVMPTALQDWCRKFSDMDNKVIDLSEDKECREKQQGL